MPNTKVPFDWQKILTDLPSNANEPLIRDRFVEHLLEAFGFSKHEWFPEFSTGKGGCKVDYAARKNVDGDIFLENRLNPYLIIEAKGRQAAGGAKISLSEKSPQYKQTREQLKDYLLSPNCKTTQWGIMTNGDFIQLFRRHGKVVFPATENYLIKRDNLAEIVTHINDLIYNPPKALSICVYNDKGGVGKTTTVTNLASVLGYLKKKVLVVDFDPQQGDLTDSLGLSQDAVKLKLSDLLIDTNLDLDVHKSILPFEIVEKNKKHHFFDLIPADKTLDELTEDDKIIGTIDRGVTRLRRLLNPLYYEYDYIIFDSPTNWGFFSKSSVYAADVVLIPTNYDNFASLKNAKKVIKQHIPEIQEYRKSKNEYGIPVALPIFFNHHPSKANLDKTHQEMKNLLTLEKKGEKILCDMDLLPLFYPNANKNGDGKNIFHVPQYAIVANGGFLRRPAALSHKTAYQYYLDLAKEYFLYE